MLNFSIQVQASPGLAGRQPRGRCQRRRRRGRPACCPAAPSRSGFRAAEAAHTHSAQLMRCHAQDRKTILLAAGHVQIFTNHFQTGSTSLCNCTIAADAMPKGGHWCQHRTTSHTCLTKISLSPSVHCSKPVKLPLHCCRTRQSLFEQWA